QHHQKHRQQSLQHGQLSFGGELDRADKRRRAPRPPSGETHVSPWPRMLTTISFKAQVRTSPSRPQPLEQLRLKHEGQTTCREQSQKSVRRAGCSFDTAERARRASLSLIAHNQDVQAKILAMKCAAICPAIGIRLPKSGGTGRPMPPAYNE